MKGAAESDTNVHQRKNEIRCPPWTSRVPFLYIPTDAHTLG